jgi:hypothetical protein
MLPSVVGNVLSGTLLMIPAYLFVDRYRQQAAYQTHYLERRLEQLSLLWTTTDRHGIQVLQALAADPLDRGQLKALGESYYLELAKAGLYLGADQLLTLRSKVGDVFLQDKGPALAGADAVAKASAIKIFRSNWRSVLNDLEQMGRH